MAKRITVVVSQSQSNHPKKRSVEEAIVAELLGDPGIDVTVVAHLYDLQPDGTSMLCLSGITGDLIVCSWMFPRAARWTLDRNDIRGQEGTTLIKSLGESEDDNSDSDNSEVGEGVADEKRHVIDDRSLPQRKLYCLDLRTHDSATPYLEEIRRIAAEQQTDTVDLMGWINGSPKPEQLNRYLGNQTNGQENSNGKPASELPVVVDESAPRRWYPVIDFARCTNCLECIDFCLFGVYGVDQAETILVEQPDNCRKGCPACSRVCPENAIIFPQHKTPSISGSPEVGGPVKIDLSKLFGAPDPGAPGAAGAADAAMRERDEQLLLAGREVVGTSVKTSNPQPAAKAGDAAKDDLDRLMDELDSFDL